MSIALIQARMNVLIRVLRRGGSAADDANGSRCCAISHLIPDCIPSYLFPDLLPAVFLQIVTELPIP